MKYLDLGRIYGVVMKLQYKNKIKPAKPVTSDRLDLDAALDNTLLGSKYMI